MSIEPVLLEIGKRYRFRMPKGSFIIGSYHYGFTIIDFRLTGDNHYDEYISNHTDGDIYIVGNITSIFLYRGLIYLEDIKYL